MEGQGVLIETPFPWDLFFRLSRDLVRSDHALAGDAAEMTRRIRPAPVVIGIENVPLSGPLLVAANHFQRRGLWIAWPGAVITDAVAKRRGSAAGIRWLVTGGLRWFQWAGRGPEVPGTRQLFAVVGRTTGLTVLPLSNSRARGTAVRSWLQHASGGEAIGIFPEGLAGRSDRLRPPEEGFERIVRLARRRSIPVLPVGISEDQRLTVRFGTPFVPGNADEVMEAIAALLPEGQRGAYGDRGGRFGTESMPDRSSADGECEAGGGGAGDCKSPLCDRAAHRQHQASPYGDLYKDGY